jgi:CelD/BcsL family acetyltransferase involved in cellulose biosynthesis
MGEPKLKIQEISRYQDLLLIKTELTGFCNKIDVSIFSTPEWLYSWIHYLGPKRRLVVLVIRDDYDSIIGFSPLIFSRGKISNFALPQIEIVGTPQSDYNNFLIGPRDNVQKAIQYLFSKYGNIQLKLTEIPESDNFIDHLTECTGLKITIEQGNDCPYLILPKTKEAFSSVLGSNFRHHIRRCKKRLEEKYVLEFVDYSKPEMVKKGLEIHFQLHENRWKSKGDVGVFSDVAIRRFNDEVAQLFSVKGSFFLYMLHANNRPIASLHGFIYKSKFLCYSTGMDPSFDSFGVGNILWQQVINNCIDAGFQEIDFLRGDEAYKNRWHAQIRKNLSVTITKKGLSFKARHYVRGRLESLGK